MQQSQQQVYEITANLDDASGEVLGEAAAALLAAGAVDVWTTPIGMKKGRPGVMVSLLCGSGQLDEMLRKMVEVTGSFGVRYRLWDRLVLQRRHETVETAMGRVRIKVGMMDGVVVAAKAEFEDVREAAGRAGVSVRAAMEAAGAAAAQWLERHKGERLT
jgi:uncharacterized protein (DUF111 family)